MGAEATGSILCLHTIGHKIPQRIYSLPPATAIHSFLFHHTPTLCLSHNAEVTATVMTIIIDSICMTPFAKGH